MSGALHLLAELAGAAGFGLGSALVPLLNAEAFAVVSSARTPLAAALLLVTALAVGQTTGKVVLFEVARRGAGRLGAGGLGAGRWRARFAARHEGGKAVRWAARIRAGLEHRRTAVPLVLAAAALGLPPLAAVSLAAGASGQRRAEFATLCLVGRTARFAALVLPAVLVGR